MNVCHQIALVSHLPKLKRDQIFKRKQQFLVPTYFPLSVPAALEPPESHRRRHNKATQRVPHRCIPNLPSFVEVWKIFEESQNSSDFFRFLQKKLLHLRKHFSENIEHSLKRKLLKLQNRDFFYQSLVRSHLLVFSFCSFRFVSTPSDLFEKQD